jgi:hypothetical protein
MPRAVSGGHVVELSGLQAVHVWAWMRGARRDKRIGRSDLECMTACLEKLCRYLRIERN